MILAIFALKFINVIARFGVIITLILCLMPHYLVKPFEGINYHSFVQRNFPIGLSGIFLITDDVIDVII